MTKSKYFAGGDDEVDRGRPYIDADVAGSFNSYDSNDKYVFVVDVQKSVDDDS